MTALIASLITALTVGIPFSLWVLSLRRDIHRLNVLLDVEIARGDTLDKALANSRRGLAKAWARVVKAEGWPPGGTHHDAAPASRPATPPPESRRRA